MTIPRTAFLAAGAAGIAVTLLGKAADAMTGDASILALYKKPADPGAFDKYYAQHHAPLAKTLPGLQSYTLSKNLGEKDPYYLVATLTFVSLDKLKAALASTQGEAVVADLKNFAQAGVEIMTFENIPA